LTTSDTLALDGTVSYAADSGGIAEIVLRRPAKLNAIGDVMAAELRERLQQFDLDDAAGVAILSGEGRAFCAGADVKRHERSTEDRLKAKVNDQRRDLMNSALNWKPVIAAVHGYVYGFGLSLALRADIIVAGRDARFQVAEIPRGLSGSTLWAALKFRGLGSFADDVVLTGRGFSAEEALAGGVINAVVDEGQHVEEGRRWAQRILANPQGAVRDSVRTRRWYAQSFLREAQILSQPHPDLHESQDFKSRVKDFSTRKDKGQDQ
jgi:enoyl-CoA hydratase/carnithine racemase